MGGRGSYSNSGEQPSQEHEQWNDQEASDWIDDNISDTTETIIDPGTGNEHEMYRVVIGGIPVYFENKNSQTIASIKAILNSNKIPQKLRSLIDGIILVPGYDDGDSSIIAEENEGIITIYGNRTVTAGIIAHETAHSLAFTLWGSADPPPGSEYYNAMHSTEPPVSEYGATKPREDWAEAIRIYVDNPPLIQRIAPLRYAAIRRIMKGY